MMRALTSRGRESGFLVALLVVAIGVSPGSALAARSTGDLSPRLAKLVGPSLRGASAARQARAIGLAPGGLARQGRRVLVNVRFDSGALAARDELQDAGAKTLEASRRYQTITAAVTPARLHAIAKVPGVEGVAPVFSPIAAAATCPSGSVVSEGDLQLNVKSAREANPGVDGAGIEVGILSDSFDQATEAGDGSGDIATHAEEDVESGDLPGANGCPDASLTPVDVLSEMNNASAASDEGRAMAQIVHDLAPGADISFASAFNGHLDFANNILALRTAGAEVIVDDVFYPEEPFFQDGPIAVAVREVVEDGASYFSAAGNNNLLDEEDHDIGSWETPEYRDAQSCPAAVQALSGVNAVHCLDFNPGSEVDRTFGIKVEAGTTLAVDLQWDEPWFGVETDLDAFLLNSSAGVIANAVEDNLGITETPAEVLEWENGSSGTRTVQLVVNRFAGAALPRVKFALIQNGGGVAATEYPRSSGEDVVGPTIFGHSGSASAISTGAVFFNDSSEPETYSSRGPVRHDFGPVESASPAAALPSPEILSKPDLVATDCGKTTFFSIFIEFTSSWHFCGTSAAAPHAAAVAALMRDAEPAAQPVDVLEALVGSAAPVGTYGPCAVGAGLVDAVGAVKEVLDGTGAAGPICEPPESEVEPEEAAASGDWGSEIPPPSSGGGTTTTTTQPQPEQTEAVAPRTFFRQRPERVLRTRHRRATAVFRFGSNEAGVSFVCRIDGGLFRPCPERLVRRFPLGWHMVEVAARNADGIGDRSPARYRFKVKRVR
jgi:subtilase family protein